VAVDICSSPPLSLVGYQAIQNLLPDILLVLSRDAFLAPPLNSRKPVLEGVHVAWGSALAFHSSHFVSSHVSGFIFPQLFAYGKVVAKS
jgi:hypothetical protein